MPPTQEPRTKNQERATRDNEVLVKVDGVSKKFCRDLKKSLWYGIKDVAHELLPFTSNKEQGTKNEEDSPALRPGEFWANQDISFELRRGECLGLIGHNGAGKTTLLKMLNGLIKPDTGTIEMRGRVGALIALGAGFNPILTGRENIYVNGSILGLSKEEIDEKVDDMIDFAEIREFIDSPVQSYSSGMQVRLGFSVATALNPDVLILDEVLAVGDADFREKCMLRISKMLSHAAVIFVSHNSVQMSRICDRGLYLERGKSLLLSDIDSTLLRYQENLTKKRGGAKTVKSLAPGVEEFSLSIPDEHKIVPGEDLELEVTVKTSQRIEAEEIMISIEDTTEQAAAQAFCKFEAGLPSGVSHWNLAVKNLLLKAGTYHVTLVLFGNGRQTTFARMRWGATFSIDSHIGVYCSYVPVAELTATSALVADVEEISSDL